MPTPRKPARKVTAKKAKKTQPGRKSPMHKSSRSHGKRKKKVEHRKGPSPVFIMRDDGTRVVHDRECRFPIAPFVPLIQKLVDGWVMPAGQADQALHRLLNPSREISEIAHYQNVGRELFEWGYYTDALDCFEHVLRAHPDDSDLLELKIAAHENIGEFDEARAWRNRLAVLRQEQPSIRRYLFDQFVDALVSSLTDVVTRHQASLTTPVERLVLGLQDRGSIIPDEAWLSLAGSSQTVLELSLTLPDTLIPWHVDRVANEDDPLCDLVRRFELDANTVSWSDPERVPASLFRLELSSALQRASTRLVDAGIAITSRCTLAVGHRGGDVLVVDRNRSRQRAREQALSVRLATELRRFPGADAVEALAWLCYADADRRMWLLDLARAR